MIDIKSIRKDLGWTQAKLATEIDISQSLLSRFESGVLPVDTRTGLAIIAVRDREKARGAVDSANATAPANAG